MNRRIWLLSSTAFLAALVIMAMVNAAGASLPAAVPSKSAGARALTNQSKGSTQTQSQYSDDFDSLKPVGLKALSMSTLVNSGRVHIRFPSRPTGPSVTNPFAPLLNITWGADILTGPGQGEPGVGINQSNPLYALVSGNLSIDNTTDGGLTWTSLGSPPNPHDGGDVVNAWLADNPDHALEIALNYTGVTYNMTCAQSTDFGVTWTNHPLCTAYIDLNNSYFNDREYIWVDNSTVSPFHGRVYVTEALFDASGAGNFNTMTNRWSSDNGTTWNPPGNQLIALVPNNEFAMRLNHNEFASMGISPNGTIGYAWHRGQCCNIITNVPNKVMFARSTDGGVSFPYSTTIVTVPISRSVMFNSASPFGSRWSDTPNIAADPSTNGVFYAIWTAYRTPYSQPSAAIYLSRSTDDGYTWSTPIIPYNNPNAGIFQGYGWVKVTEDHAVHLTYFGGTTSNTVAGQFYVQSTDGGSTWSAPFQLNATNITTFGQYPSDYIANDVTTSAGPGALIAGIEEDDGHHARMGVFVAASSTPTPTGTPPTATPSYTPSYTPSSTPVPPTPCTLGVIVNGGFETGSFSPWMILDTNNPPTVSNLNPHTGTYAALLGALSPPEPLGNSSIYQQITVPAGSSTLSYWWNGSTQDSITFDWQDAYLTDTSHNILATIMHECQTTGGWINQTFDLTPYAGLTVDIEFLVHEDGFGDVTSMYVDDVSLLSACATGTPPTSTNTPTLTRTNTPGIPSATPTCQAGAVNYTIATASGTIVPGTTDIGNQCDDCTTTITMPFGVDLYGQVFTNAIIGSNGTIGFVLNGNSFGNECLPANEEIYAILPYWDDQLTTAGLPGCSAWANGCGIFTTQVGNNFYIDFHTVVFGNTGQGEEYEVVFTQGSPNFSVVYGTIISDTAGETIGVQRDTGSAFTQYKCNTANPPITAGLQLNFIQVSCATATNTPPSTNTPVPTNTSAATNTPTNTPTNTLAVSPTGTNTAVPPTPTACTLSFTDVPPGSTFYSFIRCLACKGIVNGYSDGTFRPGNDVTRGQLSKIVSNSAGFNDNQTTRTFEDVPVGSTFFQYIGRLVSRGFISGYPCGTPPAGACVPPGNLPYFLPNANSTRGQISKIVSNAAGFSETPSGQQFQDVPVGSTFYTYIYRLVLHNVMSGYPCGTPPAGVCVPPGNLPYFLPGNNATRGQTSKIVSNTFFPACSPPEVVRQ